MSTCRTVKVKPWGTGQGEFVEINEKDFDPAVHVLVDGTRPPESLSPPEEAPQSVEHAAPTKGRRVRG